MSEQRLWAWMTQYPDGSVGTVGAWTPETGHVPLIARSEQVIRTFRVIAMRHRHETGQRIWLRCWIDYTDEEDLP